MRALLTLALLLSPVRTAIAESVTWDTCLRESVQHNPEMAAARERIVAAQERRKAGYSPFLPQLSADADWSRGSAPLSGSAQSGSVGLTVRQNLFAGWRDSSGLQKAQYDLSAAEAESRDTGAKVRAELASAFARLRYAQDALRLAETIRTRRQENVRLVELRYEAGRENKGSLLRSRAAEHQARYEVSQAGRGIRLAQRELARIMGRPPSVELNPEGDIPISPLPNESDLRALAQAVPASIRAQANARAAAATVHEAQSTLYPSLSAAASALRAGETLPTEENRWTFGVSLSYPFFPGGRTVYDIRTAKAEYHRAEAAARNILERAVVDLEESLAGYRDAMEKSDVQADFLDAARLRAEIGRSQYSSGLLSFQDWDLIENDLISSEKAWLAARRDLWLAQAAWDKSQGKGLEP